MTERRADRRTDARPFGPPGFAARRAAADLVEGVLERKRSLLEQAGPEGPLPRLAPVDRARAQGIAAQVLRHLAALDFVLDRFLRRRPEGRAMTALRVAAAEMLLDGIAPHAAVDAAVTLVRAQPKVRHLAPLVNAVARKVADGGPALLAKAPPPRLPGWLAGPVEATWGEDAARVIAAAHAAEAPLDLTCRAGREAEGWAERLGASLLPTGSLRLPARGQVSALPGFSAGAWWVQDAAAAVPARMLGKVEGLRVLDLCAAPGGKTLQLAAAGAPVTALDVSEARLGRLRENLERVGLEAEVVAADALEWTPTEPYDAILLDAPCSATGTIRRHPDLPYLKAEDDLSPLVTLQSALLRRAWDWLRPGGRLVYAVCSLLPAEGEAQVDAFLRADGGASQVRPDVDLPEGWLDGRGALRTRPDFWADRGGVDGFFAALLAKA